MKKARTMSNIKILRMIHDHIYDDEFQSKAAKQVDDEGDSHIRWISTYHIISYRRRRKLTPTDEGP